MSNETKFTPGPWRFMGCEVVGANNSTVAVMVNDGNHTVPNQYLITAAPEMYQELSDLAADYHCECGHPRCRIEETRRGIDALLSQARGEQ